MPAMSCARASRLALCLYLRRLRPARSGAASWFGRGWRGLSAGFGSHRVGVFVVHFREHRAVILDVIFRKQGRDFTQFFGSLLQHFDLLAQLRVLRLLATQNLMDILHTSPCA